MSSTVDLSIIIPTYNRLLHLKEALASFVGLLDCSYEVIIVDDGSTDGTPEYLRTLGPPCRVFFQEHRGGNAARNYGLREARGRYVKYFDDDDLLNPHMVDGQVRYLDTHPEVNVCFSDFEIWWDQQGDRGESRNIVTPGSLDDPITAILEGWRCPNFAILYRADVARLVCFAPDLWNHQDVDYSLQVAIHGGRFTHLSGVVGCYRKHSLQTISEIQGIRRILSRLQMHRRAYYALAIQQSLTARQRHLLAQRYFQDAVSLYEIGNPLFRVALSEIKAMDPGFVPPGRKFRFIARLFGYAPALKLKRLYSLVRRSFSQMLTSKSSSR